MTRNSHFQNHTQHNGIITKNIKGGCMVTDYTKQMELIEVHKFDKRINIIGCGAVGSWLSFFLLKMGFKNIHVYDFDVVEEHNLPNQMFTEKQIGKEKVQALFELYSDLFQEEKNRLTIHKERVTKDNAIGLQGVVFCCVDSMGARRDIYTHCYKYGQAELWIEGRIGLFGAYVYTLNEKNLSICEKYQDTLYADEEAEVSACGVSQTALPAAVSCVTTMIMQMIAWHRGNELQNVIQYQLPDYLNITEKWTSLRGN